MEIDTCEFSIPVAFLSCPTTEIDTIGGLIELSDSQLNEHEVISTSSLVILADAEAM